jgi:hypothetical protein
MTMQLSLEPDDMPLIVQLGWSRMSGGEKEAPAWTEGSATFHDVGDTAPCSHAT